MNASIGDAKMSEIDEVFAKIAEKAGVFDESFTKEKFLQDLHNWEMAVNPAYTEHKIALGYGVFGAPKSVIDEQLIVGTESSWGPSEWTREINRLTHSIEL